MKVLVTLICLAVGSAAAGDVRAADGFKLPGFGQFGIAPAPSKLIDDQPRAAERVKPLEAVLDTIRRRLPGRALGARLVQWQGREAYEIRWIGENGKVHDITADAVSGDILDER
ncbi:MAG: hypothetical protein AAGA21_00420 [Pseudomonadota bacterium]